MTKPPYFSDEWKPITTTDFTIIATQMMIYCIRGDKADLIAYVVT